MESNRISTLKACVVLLLSAGLLFGCKPISEEKPLSPKEESKEVTAAPEPAPVAPPAAASAPVEPATDIEEITSIESLGSDSASAPAPAPEIDDGDDVVTVTPAIMRKVQQALVNAGFNPGPVDGVSGAKTVSAIESFQKQNGIPAGKITKKTLRALGVDF
ncbi:MAG: peptidoglycan-binding domain-containing protein [Nitrosomonas sp.]|nr:peptidoglycan-binding domain-containing protein [Nitrosomonas sp.]